MEEIIAVGYSFSDPHLTWLLERLAHLFRGAKPIYAIMSDAEAGDVVKFRRDYNVEVITYKTIEGSHARLLSLFRSMEPFVLARSPRGGDYATPTAEHAEEANQLFLFATFHVDPQGVDFKVGAYRALIAATLKRIAKPLDKKQLIDGLPLNVKVDFRTS